MTPQAARAWAIALALTTLALPWYGQEKLLSGLLAGDALPLGAVCWTRPWLLPLLAVPVAAAIGPPCRFWLRRHLKSPLHLDPPAQG